MKTIKKIPEVINLKIILIITSLFLMSFTLFDDIYVNSLSTKNELNFAAKEWTISSFEGSSKEIQLEDNNTGTIIFKSSFKTKVLNEISDAKVDFTIKIQVRQGRYKFWINKLNHVSNKAGYSGGDINQDEPNCGFSKMSKNEWKQIKKQTIETMENNFKDLNKRMNFNGNIQSLSQI